MKPKNVIYSLLVIVLMLVLAMLKLRNEPQPREIFDRKPHSLSYTKHALCRMDCRHITKEDISEVMSAGVINLNKSDKRERPCPTFALQGRTRDGQYIRVVFAQCEAETKVVTCYDLEKDFECHCPGDEFKNRN
jgi:hypothetical protein